ncbi:nucleotidyltransferase family protein [Sphingopyxis sp. BSNA05]|uniref:nucleotidyltransferase family protein n=1 Tax=Sphingopyxis sp. BSNA05 TaxID=1236614 RepID=UPI0015659C76|nr:nucleotidyltransferase family protein [Sphingopyxis sp. BSNA05]
MSRYLRPALSLPLIDVSEPISETLATFAVSRHRVGPLLHLAMQSSADVTADDNASSILETAYQNNIFAGLKQKAAEKNISKLLNAHSVPFSILKGRGLAEQLHDDSTARQSKDVDILIPPDQSRQTIELLNREGYIYKATTMRRTERPVLRRQDTEIRRFKDITFVDPAFSVPIELHQRLFKFEPPSLTEDFSESVKFNAIPSLSNSFYCLYIVLHGALAMWPRLKWLVDLSILARKMPADNRREMLEIASAFGSATAVAASLLLAEQVFPDSLDDEWLAILNPYQEGNDTGELTGLFYQTLTAEANGRPILPLKSSILSGSADIIFSGKVGLVDTVLARVLNSIFARI